MTNEEFIKRCEEAKKALYHEKGVHYVCMSLLGSRFTGKLVEMYNSLDAKNALDFAEKYFDYAEEHYEEDNIKRGLTKKELRFHVDKYYKEGSKKASKEYDYSTYYYDMCCHLFVETANGCEREHELESILLQQEGVQSISYPIGKYDNVYGIDRIITVGENDKEYAVQIKPASFFMGAAGYYYKGGSRMDTYIDMACMLRKWYMTASEGITTHYAIYNVEGNKNEWLLYYSDKDKKQKLLHPASSLFKEVNITDVQEFMELTNKVHANRRNDVENSEEMKKLKEMAVPQPQEYFKKLKRK